MIPKLVVRNEGKYWCVDLAEDGQEDVELAAYSTGQWGDLAKNAAQEFKAAYLAGYEAATPLTSGEND